MTQTLGLYGLDSVGNRSDPMSLTFRVDTVAPAIIYFTHTTTLWPGEPFLMVGSVSDGSGVRAMHLSGLAPNQEHLAEVMNLEYESTLGAGRGDHADDRRSILLGGVQRLFRSSQRRYVDLCTG